MVVWGGGKRASLGNNPCSPTISLLKYCLLFMENPVTSGNGSKWRTNLRNHKQQVIKSQTEIFPITPLMWLTKIVQFSAKLSLHFLLDT